jgi:hypothetical protein
MLDRLEQFGLEHQHVIVIIDGFGICAELEMDVPHVIPGIDHVPFIAQGFGELVQSPIVKVAHLFQRVRLLIGIRRARRDRFQILGLIERFHAGVEGLLGRGIRFFGGRQAGLIA